MSIISLIRDCAEIPSFSTQEYRLCPFIESIVSKVKNATLERVLSHNIVISVPGKKNLPPVALTAHLDKINHFGDWGEKRLSFARKRKRIQGQLDDSVGVGICLSLLTHRSRHLFPPLLILLSEMEEHGDYEQEEGSDLFNGIGSCRISQYIMDKHATPAMFITIDTSPQFKGDRGIALYTRFWERCSLKPEERLVSKTEEVERFLLHRFPFLYPTQGSNDYINYGMLFNSNHEKPAPSIAIEPAIFPSHRRGEEVFISDIKRVARVTTELLVAYAKSRIPD